MYREKLTELLKTVPEIKQDLEEMKSHKWFHTKWMYNYWFLLWPEDAFFPWIWYKKVDKEYLELQTFEWELEERHLRMYSDRKNIRLFMNYFSNICYFWEDNKEVKICKLDNSKSFSNQSEEFYEKLYNYLITIE